MELQFFGAAQEVGRSCILVDNRFLFDAGIMIGHEQGNHYPEAFNVKAVQAVFLSHAHLDHSGALPFFNKQGMQCSTFTTKMTKELCNILLYDSLKVESITKGTVAYTEEHVRQALELMAPVKYNKEVSFDDITYSFYDAGHIPGSASILLTINNRKILYTGDINHIKSRLLEKASYRLNDVDTIITEGTYGDRDHPSRKEEEQRFFAAIRNALGKGGSVVIPAFAVGRAQEILLLLNETDFHVPIYIDGMAREVTGLLLKRPETIRDSAALQRACKNVGFVKNLNKRRAIVQQQGIFVTTSGMLDGGPILEYLKNLHNDKRHALLITGYQDEDSNGYRILQGEKIMVDNLELRWKGHYERFDFSAHSDQQALLSSIKQLQPKHVVIVHTDSDVGPKFQQKIQEICNADVHLPRLGECLHL